ncbi:MAG: iron-containing redox enzyme family protein [Nocardioides sp.]
MYELMYRGFDEVDDGAEWDAGFLRLRRRLETDLEARLRSRWSGPAAASPDLASDLFSFFEDANGPSVARFIQTSANAEQAREFLKVKSIYHLKESDPTTWVLPRLPVVAKAALAELQYDEYGAGDPNRLHHHLFARGLQGAGLTSSYGAYIDEAPVAVLEQNNTVSLFGLHRRLRGAAVGHLAAFEATSSIPSRRLAQGFERVGLGQSIVDYYAEHVSADAVHDQLAVRSICGGLVAAEPEQRAEVFFGAFTCLDLERRFAEVWLAQWEEAAA